MNNVLQTALSSLVIGEKKYNLVPSDLTQTAPDTFERVLDGVRVTLTLHDGGEWFTACLRLTNTFNENSPQMKFVKPLDMAFDFADKPVFESISGDNCGAVSFVPFVNTLDENLHIEPLNGRSSDTTGFPFFDIGDDKTTYVFGIGWTGQWCLDVSRYDNRCTVSVGMTDCDFYLKPHESVRLPSVIVMKGGERTAARMAFRNLLREKFAPRVGGDLPELPIAIQPFDRYFWNEATRRADWSTEAGQLEEAERIAKCGGFDALWIDAAWFKKCFPDGVGNYSYEVGFPRGLRPVADRVHAKGLRFVLWFEIERVMRDTEIYLAHPEWMITIEGRKRTLYNLANDDACAYLTKLVGDMLEENAVDVFRQDFNMSPLEFWRAAEEPNRCGVNEMHYVENLYRMWDDLRARFPHLLIDNCSSGGRRLDFETMQRSVALWRSDTGCSEDKNGDTNSVWNHMQTLSLNRYLPLTCCATWEMSPYAVRGVFTGGIACNFDILSDSFDYQKAGALVQECRRCRPYWAGTFVPLTQPTPGADDWAAYQLDCGTCGCVYYFRKKHADDTSFSAPLRGIDASKEYVVTMTDENMHAETTTMKGSALCNLSVTIAAPRAGILLEYKAIDE